MSESTLQTTNKQEINLFKHIPNALTLTRIGISGYVSYLLATDGPSIEAGAYYAGGAITDFLDGYIARNFNAQSDLGKRLDPMADSISFHLPLWGLAISSNEVINSIIYLGTSGLLMFRDGKLFKEALELEKIGKVFQVSKLGKIKTAIQMSALSILIATPENYRHVKDLQDLLNPLIDISSETYKSIRELGIYLLGAGAFLSIASLADYIRKLNK
nr:CDP-alcohol phosphatidyltransferase family protein [Candidatus Gracilibacteria bacterium]